MPDHPRIRGEHFNWVPIKVAISGSSPHTRGAQIRAHGPDPAGRIIPAYAGSTSIVFHAHSIAWDHPRIRGEHSWKSLQYQGSPP